ncbi:ethylmalonyl-CoA decarboxylase-like isoform X2 [Anoplophora glabripennis]|uniref:ethylmalonyl-CoA decarboxylase-like isoform X2 n=1 Tax=Anoplophora glabripennis TaxID=217634 RepID=UPI0008749928|nr:ethylmalonyl-CoA decarboxylase-like isoform X2 [Anoplophora glabripennis]
MAEFIKDVDFGVMESNLLKYDGGEIFLSKEYFEEGIAIIYLNHPRKRNAISGKMMVDFRRCLNELEEWKEGKSVLLCGLGSNFCSGGDLDFARSAGTPKEGYYMSCIMQDILKRFRGLPLITVSLLHGPTLGGGAEISIFSDYILVADNAQIGFVQGNMGLITAFGGTTRLVQLIGERKAMEMLLTSKVYSAEECISISLADKIVNTSNY